MRLCSKKVFNEEIKPNLEFEFEKGCHDFISPEYLEDKAYQVEKDLTIQKVFEYTVQRRHWYKAFEIIIELVTKAYKLNEIKRRTAAICNQIHSKDLLNTSS